MQRLLIANRGEIVVRIARTAREMGISTVSIHAPEDEALSAGYGVDERVALPGKGAAAYLDVDAILEIARRHRCDALHPGYGFLSESAELAHACKQAGIRFVGPEPETLELFGDKAAARALAVDRGVPVVPGIPAPASVTDARSFFEETTERFPGSAIVLKAIAGGGGRGMRVVRSADELEDAFARCQSEALRSFGSDILFAECFLEDVRHVEVQILADHRGQVGHLWERDCTLQRQHQKLVEIAPSPGLDPALRTRLIEAARKLANAANYHGIGTFEFLIDRENDFFFMEANPRLQVEHTISEEITGVDLVGTQLDLARSVPLDELGLLEPPPARGHAIQFRVLAEALDKKGRALPSVRPIEVFEAPAGPGIRVDTAMHSGLSPHPAFDSLLAKLIVWSPGPDFERTVRRARRALSEFRVEGPRTNLDLLAALADRPEFPENALTTGFLAQHARELVAEARAREADRKAASSRPAEPAPDESERRLPEESVAVRAPLIGTVIEVCVEERQAVAIGQPILVLESMKMEHVVTAEAAGRLESLFARPGDVVGEAEILAGIVASGSDETRPVESEVPDPDFIRPDLAELRARNALLLDENRPEAVERRRRRGQRTARENLEDLCDPGSFVEYGALAVAAMRKSRPLEELQRKTPGDAIITGFGTINADTFGSGNSRCAILVVDATVLAGTQGYYHHHKIDRLLELAERHRTPIVFFPEGGGGRPNDTDPGNLVVAGLNITSFHAFARLSGKVPRISVVSGFCFAGSAAFAGSSDLIIATRNTSLGMGGPAMIEGGGLGVFDPKEIGPASVLDPVGVLDLLVEDEAEAVAATRRILAYFQGPIGNATCGDQRVLRHLIPENRRRVYDIRKVIDGLCDTDSVLELRRSFGVGMITALVRIGGQPFGLIANDPMHLGGAIDDTAAEKAARFLQLCDAFGLPIVSLCDTPGFMVGPEIETRGQVRKVSRLFVAGAALRVPLFTIILRKGYGLGAQAMAGGSFVAPAYIAAWPTGEIGGMGLEGAVRLGFKRELEEVADEAERQRLFEKLVGRMVEKGKALNAASQLEFDAVIDPAETRDHILRSLEAAGPPFPGSGRFIDTW